MIGAEAEYKKHDKKWFFYYFQFIKLSLSWDSSIFILKLIDCIESERVRIIVDDIYFSVYQVNHF